MHFWNFPTKCGRGRRRGRDEQNIFFFVTVDHRFRILNKTFVCLLFVCLFVRLFARFVVFFFFRLPDTRGAFFFLSILSSHFPNVTIPTDRNDVTVGRRRFQTFGFVGVKATITKRKIIIIIIIFHSCTSRSKNNKIRNVKLFFSFSPPISLPPRENFFFSFSSSFKPFTFNSYETGYR